MLDKFDIVICVGPNDFEVINIQIEYTKKNIIGYRNIYLITPNEDLKIDNCITIKENIFPFGRANCQNRRKITEKQKEKGADCRTGWYLQQLLKLYAGICIPNILDRYLVVDADTFFLKPTTFIENDKCLYNTATEYHKPYFVHMENLGIGLKRYDEKISGICHHMMFETKYVKEIMDHVENIFNQNFYNVFLNNIDNEQFSGASEYEIYFNYMIINHSDKIKIRNLQWSNINSLEFLNSNYDYISYHWHKRQGGLA